MKGIEPASTPVKTRVLTLLEESGYGDKRSAKLDQDDFFKLLALFNKEGFHFVGVE
jgi:18S rRNA (adenine1779-N6/adenine1780-N6)-dimethyltransferase